MKVLTNYNNLKYFMKITSLNERQVRWAVTSVPRIPTSLHPFDTAFLWHFPFRLSVSWQIHSAIHIWSPSQYIVVLYLVVLFNTPTWLDSVLILTWAMKLLMFDFFIIYRSEKTNSVDALSRRSNYKSENESLNRLLLTL